MRLSRIEFIAMNNPVRRLIQKHVEFRDFRNMGLTVTGKDILEIGCGSGYGGILISTLKPASYRGIDIMPEQIALALKRKLAGYIFLEMDATDMKPFPSSSADEVLVFGILHHIPEWRKVLDECFRILRPGGSLYVEEPDGNFLRKFDRIMHWGHPAEARFSLDVFEKGIEACGFAITERKKRFGFGVYRADKLK